MIEAFIIIIVVSFALYRPMIGIALISQIYLIRSLVYLRSGNPCFVGDCLISSSPLLGVSLPLLVFFIAIIKASRTKIRYSLDSSDILFVSYIIVMLIGCIYSPDILDSIDYFGRFLLIGVSYFFVTKFYLSNSVNRVENIRCFLLTTYFTCIFLSFVAMYHFIGSGASSIRLTLPGVHPIPFSLLVGSTFIISLSIFLSNGEYLKISSKYFLRANVVMCLLFFLTQLATNTRGVTISMILSAMLLIILSVDKIRPKLLLVGIPIMISILVYIINKIGFEKLFGRFMNITKDQSVGDRSVAYIDSVKIFSDNILLGGGTNSFKFFSQLGYPHNLFLENLASFGSLGLIINCGFIGVFCYYFLKIIKQGPKNYTLIVLYALTIFFFIETMFSFTIWMHKSLYLFFALLGFYRNSNVSSVKKNPENNFSSKT